MSQFMMLLEKQEFLWQQFHVLLMALMLSKPKTRDKVLEAIQRLDFKPNQIARGLATSKTTTIAIVFPQSLFAHVKDMIGGIGDTSRRLDYNVSIYTTDEIGDGNPIETVIEKSC